VVDGDFGDVEDGLRVLVIGENWDGAGGVGSLKMRRGGGFRGDCASAGEVALELCLKGGIFIESAADWEEEGGVWMFGAIGASIGSRLGIEEHDAATVWSRRVRAESGLLGADGICEVNEVRRTCVLRA